MANNIDLTISAPKPSFRRFRCSAWLIQLRQRTALSPLKRSCFSRFAASEPRTALPFLCAFLVGLFSVSAPNRLFKPLRCSAWLILRRSPTGTSAPKRSCSRFASLTLRTAAPSYRFFVLFSKTHDLQVRFAHPPNPAPLSRFFSISRRSGLMAPLCKGSCPASSRTEGLPPD